MDPVSLIMALKDFAPNMGQIGTGLKMASSLGKTAYGAGQLIGNKRPEDFQYNMPTEVMEALQIARNRTQNPLPGADLQRERIGQTTAKGMMDLNKRGGASGAALGAASELLSREYDALNSLAVTESNASMQAERGLQNQLSNLAQYRDREFDMNVRRPYEQALAEFFQKRNAGTANLFGGLNDMGNTAESYFQNQMLMEELGSNNNLSGSIPGFDSKGGGQGSVDPELAFKAAASFFGI